MLLCIHHAYQSFRKCILRSKSSYCDDTVKAFSEHCIDWTSADTVDALNFTICCCEISLLEKVCTQGSEQYEGKICGCQITTLAILFISEGTQSRGTK